QPAGPVVELRKPPAAPPPVPEGYEATGMNKAHVPSPAPASPKTAGRSPAPQARPAAPAKPAERPSGRHLQRVRMEAAVDLESESNFFMGFSTDISEGGLFVATADLLPIGSEIDLRFTLPSGQAVDVQGVVRWRRELDDSQPEIFPGIGVQFRSLPSNAAGAIQRFVGAREPLFFPD
ncbi:MAG: TIGR02266 family protein, partial [Deltaproteobacteria bacterium]|nr:TIGR02266 family protein [Deltaproteobacteria bacterium]